MTASWHHAVSTENTMDNVQRHDRLIVLIGEAMELSKENLYYDLEPSDASLVRKELSDRLQEMDILLQQLGECPMCGQEVLGAEPITDAEAMEAILLNGA